MPGPHSLRRVLLCAIGALSVGLGGVSLIVGFSDSLPVRILQAVAVFGAGAAVLGSAVVLAMIGLAGWKDPESEAEFEALVRRSERLAASGELHLPDEDDEAGALALPMLVADAPLPREGLDELATRLRDGHDEFAALVRAAIDELPLEFHRALEHVAIVVSDEGWRYGAYGLYQGDTVAQDYFHDRILVFRDTLMRDFGGDRSRLAAQVRRTLRHELAHHLGWDEKGVRGLGL